MALLLAAGLLAVPAVSGGSPAAACCGADCSPCPLSFCKTTRADRAVIPTVAALAPAAVHVVASLDASPHGFASPDETLVAHAPRAFRPLRN
jgi:hypothetical protein